ncbi:response regulator transcription factor [Shewanella woodyi]|uniref:Response regulator receiver protein n=1 Tax=Shewanella woodyi (strain ATCC 51908 / MS32) TaxID=392500 RepID=B1KIS0_SHEWM|nr:response regulator transcription factor [Shewanella woodyi]ACA85568.1 response regulator receiver protein [Shewanella woodyi ATCC 51908]
MAQIRVWVVDDDPDYCELISEVLSDDYQVTLFNDANSYRTALELETPELILMDINLPDVSGIELCQELMNSGKDVAVIFVSGMNTLEERLRAYEVSAVDFIAKPFELKELQAKVQAVASYQAKKQSLVQAESMSRNMAFQSMTESSQYGAVLQFFRQCFLCNDYQSLADAFFELMQQLNLSTCLEIRDMEVHYFAPQNAEISPIEANILELLDKHGRLYDFGSRTICNDKHVSFLIKNMPMDDEVLYGRLRDVIAVIVEGLEARVMDIGRQKTLEHVFKEIQGLLGNISGAIVEHDQKFSAALTGVTTEIRSSFHVLDMTEEQEDYFASLVERNLKEASSAGDAFYRLQGSLKTVRNVVESSVS